MDTIKTNRTLYLAVARLVKQEAKNKRSLESYLLALLSLGREYQQRETLTPDEFFEMLTKAFHETALPFNEMWREQEYNRTLEGFLAWQNRIIYQIVDLRNMEEAGALNNEMRYFGIDAPRGGRWYNFEPGSFLECGMAGTFGGWQEGDDTGREYVPGPVAVLGESGKIESADPRDIDDPVVELEAITWDKFTEFLFDGQNYE
jgi:hypothetical protein